MGNSKEVKEITKIHDRIYKYNLNIAILIIIVVALSILRLLGLLPNNSISTGIELVILVLAILAHINTRKLRLRNVGYLLIYLSNGIEFPFFVAIIIRPDIIMSFNFRVIVAMFNLTSLVLLMIAGFLCYGFARKTKKGTKRND